jgi:hypothetical protein
MPILIASRFVDKTNQAYEWKCSTCAEKLVFAIDRVTAMPTDEQVKRVDQDFVAHCAKNHPGEIVIGLYYGQLR